MQSILDAINEWIKEILIGAINGNLSTMFGDVNEKVGTIAAEVGQTPQGWNAGIFSMIQSLSENVIVPIAGLVITYVLCVELISMVTEKNNMLIVQDQVWNRVTVNRAEKKATRYYIIHSHRPFCFGIYLLSHTIVFLCVVSFILQC